MKNETIIQVAEDFGFDSDELRALAQEVQNANTDFEICNYRFIRDSVIDQTLEEELLSDTYILGCFNPGFLAECTDIDIRVFEALHKAGACEACGELVKDHIETIADRYQAYDGYGHHFAHYDQETHECGDYYAFKVN